MCVDHPLQLSPCPLPFNEPETLYRPSSARTTPTTASAGDVYHASQNRTVAVVGQINSGTPGSDTHALIARSAPHTYQAGQQ
jgi:hypothetical protein